LFIYPPPPPPEFEYDPKLAAFSGRSHCLKSTIYPIKDQYGVVLNVILTNEDVTEYKDILSSLEYSENKYRSLFNNMINGFALHKIILDTNGNPIDYIYLDVNRAFEYMTGLEKEAIIAKKVTEVLPGIEKESANWIEKFGAVTLSGKGTTFDEYCEVLGKWFSVSAYSHDENCFATIFKDITQRKKYEKKVMESNIEIEKAHKHAIQMLAIASEYKDNETGNHINRISEMVTKLALELGMQSDLTEIMGVDSILHDVGKIKIPDDILLKPGKLTAEEFEKVKEHTTIGAVIRSYTKN